MTIAQRIELRKMGYTKEEINELAEMEKDPAPEAVEPPAAEPEQLELDLTPEPPANPDMSAQLLSAINNLTAVLQNQKLNNTPQPETHKETADEILNNLLKG